MYSRYPNYRFSGGLKVPENYSGNAFKAAEINDEEPVIAQAEDIHSEVAVKQAADTPRSEGEIEKAEEIMAEGEPENSLPVGKRVKSPALKFNIGKLFSGGFGFEELLIIGLILLISQNETDDDIILLLVILLFVG